MSSERSRTAKYSLDLIKIKIFKDISKAFKNLKDFKGPFRCFKISQNTTGSKEISKS